MLGVYAYSIEKQIVGLSLYLGSQFTNPSSSIIINGVRVTIFFEQNLFNEEQKILLSLLGINFFEKGRSFLMFSDPKLRVLYVGNHSDDILHQRSRIWFRMTDVRTYVLSTNTVDEMLSTLAKQFDPAFIRNLRRKFHLELERRQLLDAHTALSATLPEGSLVLDSLPTQTLYQMMDEDRVRNRRNYQR